MRPPSAVHRAVRLLLRLRRLFRRRCSSSFSSRGGLLLLLLLLLFTCHSYFSHHCCMTIPLRGVVSTTTNGWTGSSFFSFVFLLPSSTPTPFFELFSCVVALLLLSIQNEDENAKNRTHPCHHYHYSSSLSTPRWCFQPFLLSACSNYYKNYVVDVHLSPRCRRYCWWPVVVVVVVVVSHFVVDDLILLSWPFLQIPLIKLFIVFFIYLF